MSTSSTDICIDDGRRKKFPGTERALRTSEETDDEKDGVDNTVFELRLL
jgi:hypothetical protein